MDNMNNTLDLSENSQNNRFKDIHRLYPIIAFVLNACIFFLILCSKKVIGNNNYSIMRGDLYQQYVAFITDFLNTLKGESSFWYSFSNYVGSGNVLTNAYYALNPFNFLFLVAGDNIGACAIVIITLKLALASATFVYFLQKNVNAKNSFFIILGLFYGLSGYSIALHFNIMWLDAIYALPILIHLIIRFIKTEKYIGLIVLYSYIFITNFYIAYMVGIFSALFFIAYLLIYVDYDLKNNVKVLLSRCIKYGLSVLLSIGLCAFVLFSTFGFLSNHMASDNFSFSVLTASIVDFFNAFFIGEMPDFDNKVPFLYCGIPSIALAFMFFLSKKIDKKIKFTYGGLVLFYFICMTFMPLYKFMHAFDYPNFYGYRFSFVIIFMILYMAAISFEKIEASDMLFFKVFSIISVLFYSVMMTFQRILYSMYNLNTQEGLLINALFIFLWYFALCKKFGDNEKRKYKNKNLMLILAIVLCCTELWANGYMMFGNFSFVTADDNVFNEWYYSQKEAIGKIKEKDDSFYRVYVNNDFCLNSGKMFGYNSLTTFSSADNFELRSALYKMGMETSNRVLVASSYVPGLFELLGAKYYVDIPRYSEWKDIDINADNYLPASVVEKDNVLGLGYMVNEKIFDFGFELNAFNNIERLCNYMSGLDEDIYESVPMDDVYIHYVNYDANVYNNRYIFNHISNIVSDSNVLFYLPEEAADNNVYMHIYQEYPDARTETPSIIAEESGFSADAIVASGGVYKFIKDSDDFYKISFSLDEIAPIDFSIDNLAVSKFNADAFEKVYNELSKNQLEIIENTSDYIVGKVVATEDKNVLFTSIPYDKEWVTYIDGVPSDKYLVIGDAFIALKLDPGEHIVTFQYIEEYSNIGAIITFVSMLIFVFILLINVFKKKDDNKKVNKTDMNE